MAGVVPTGVARPMARAVEGFGFDPLRHKVTSPRDAWMLLEGGEVWAEVVQSPSLQTPQATSKYRVLRSHAARGAGMWLDLRSGLLGARAQPAGLGCSWRLDDCLEAPPPQPLALGSWGPGRLYPIPSGLG